MAFVTSHIAPSGMQHPLYLPTMDCKIISWIDDE